MITSRKFGSDDVCRVLVRICGLWIGFDLRRFEIDVGNWFVYNCRFVVEFVL